MPAPGWWPPARRLPSQSSNHGSASKSASATRGLAAGVRGWPSGLSSGKVARNSAYGCQAESEPSFVPSRKATS
eukprot:8694051-Alexandrium_andersonii.AAC.1